LRKDAGVLDSPAALHVRGRSAAATAYVWHVAG